MCSDDPGGRVRRGIEMNTPIVDFVKHYAESDVTRLHMPGHKGRFFLGCEALDITEISGADVLGSAEGIIAESEKQAAQLFGTAYSFYSTEGSSLVIKAMLALVTAKERCRGERPLILAGRNVHKAFLYGCALLDLDVAWLYPDKFEHLCSCKVSGEAVKEALEKMEKRPAAVYLTSPDYLGNLQDVRSIAGVCKKYGIPLLVDNAHGAYLKFMQEDLHPITLGATMCADSAHKTLPVLTGGAYLHLSKEGAQEYGQMARTMLSIFASTSPSYLILQSLDLCNRYLEEEIVEQLKASVDKVAEIKKVLLKKGDCLEGQEALKIVIRAKKLGYTGTELAEYLSGYKIEVEFADKDYLVLMFSTENREIDYQRVRVAFENLEKREEQEMDVPKGWESETCMSIRASMFAAHRMIPVDEAENQICGAPSVSCPPAVPIVISGEKIRKEAIAAFRYYGIENIAVVEQGNK